MVALLYGVKNNVACTLLVHRMCFSTSDVVYSVTIANTFFASLI